MQHPAVADNKLVPVNSVFLPWWHSPVLWWFPIAPYTTYHWWTRHLKTVCLRACYWICRMPQAVCRRRLLNPVSTVEGSLLNNTSMWVCGCFCCVGSTAQQCFHEGLWLCLLWTVHSSTILPCGFAVVFLAVKVPLLNNASMWVCGCVCCVGSTPQQYSRVGLWLCFLLWRFHCSTMLSWGFMVVCSAWPAASRLCIHCGFMFV